jgi:hypothetical protein
MRTLAEYPSPNGPTWKVEFKDLDEELRFLRRLILQSRELPQIRALAMKIVTDAGVAPRDKKAQALAVANWVKANIYYVHELPERFAYPTETLRSKNGDCDDFTTLIGSLIESIGIPSMMVCMKVGGRWSHIFPAAQTPNGLLPLDATNRFGVDVNPIDHAKQAGKSVSIKLA